MGARVPQCRSVVKVREPTVMPAANMVVRMLPRDHFARPTGMRTSPYASSLVRPHRVSEWTLVPTGCTFVPADLADNGDGFHLVGSTCFVTQVPSLSVLIGWRFIFSPTVYIV